MSWRPELGQGPLNADLWVVGQDFSTEDASATQPFQGQPGQLLGQTLRFAGLERSSIRLDTLLPFAGFNHDPKDVAWGRERLTRLLASASPKLIVGLGDEVAKFLLGAQFPSGDSVHSFRGYLWDTAFGRVLTTVNPVAVLRDWTPWRALLNLDFRRAAAELSAGCPALDQRDVTIVTSPAELEELRDAIQGGAANGAAQVERVRQVLRNSGRDVRTSTRTLDEVRGVSAKSTQGAWLAVDIENHADLTLACMGFAPDPRRAWVIPAVPGWQTDAIRELCESATPKVLANGQYDRFFLHRFCGIELRNQVFDVQLAWHCLPGTAQIDTLQGSKSIESLVGQRFWTWSWKDGKPWPAQATAFKTREQAKLLRVRILRRGKPGLQRRAYPSDEMSPVDIVCTPEHRFLALDGRWIEAKDLVCGDSLARVALGRNKQGRAKLYIGKRGVSSATYVLECLGQPVPRGKQVHHKDEDPSNDDPSNLEIVTRAEHNERHKDVLWTGDHRRGLPAPNRGWIGGKTRDTTQFQQLYDAGMSVREIARQMHSAERTIRQHLTSIRSMNEAQQVRREKERNCRVLSVTPLVETADVYCLSVPETECFTTQGVVVHNCLQPELAGKKLNTSAKKKTYSRTTVKSLKFLSSIYTRDAYWKLYGGSETDQMRLCALDCAITLDISLKQARQLEAS